MMQTNRRAVRQAADNAATCSLIAVLLLLLIIGLVSYRTTKQLLQTSARVGHSHQVIDSLDDVLLDLQNAETGQRGFLLTGSSDYLAPYELGRQAVQPDLDTVRRLTQDNPLQQQRVETLQGISSAKLAELDQTIELRRHVGPAAALAVVRNGRGKTLMDSARQVTAAMKAEEVRLLTVRTAEAQAAGAAARTWVGFGALLGMLLSATALLFVSRYLRQRERAEETTTRLLEEARDAAVLQRNFVKDVLASVTEGRLSLCDVAEELPAPQAEHGGPITLTAAAGLRELRQAAMAAAHICNFEEGRVHDLATSVSEAGMNAIAHGGGGLAQVRTDGQSLVQIWIVDHGAGITLSTLPQATLERGYSSAGTLGHGFWLMLKLVDRLFLLTGPEGTTLVLEQTRDRREAPWLAKETKSSGLTFRTTGSAESNPATYPVVSSFLSAPCEAALNLRR